MLSLVAASALCAAVAFDRILPESLRSDITWMAADERAGRMTPSLGLEASADYLASQFRAAELAPGGSDGTFFQKAAFAQVTPSTDIRMTLDAGGRQANLAVRNISIRSLAAIEYQNTPIVRLPVRSMKDSFPEIAGRVVVGDETFENDAALHSLEARKPSLILLAIDGQRPKEETPLLMDADASIPPVIRIYSRIAANLLAGRDEVELTLHVPPPIRRDVTLRNVAGILRGSDPALRDQFVIVSAHYDHLGTKSPGQGNRVYHGANDNASGVASLIEIARGLAEAHLKRSVLFLALFGEEEGLLGSAYYVRHPLIPIARTVADINLEQLGRTDSSDGPEMARFALTGPSYSNLPQMMSPAAKTAGVAVYKKDTADDYFDRSDNYSFALAGIVAHTIVVAFEFADYHAVSDEANKIDYSNLARVDRGIAAGIEAVADAAETPKWSDAKGARIYRDAGK